MDAASRTLHLKKIENAFVKSREYGDDKVQLALKLASSWHALKKHATSSHIEGKKKV